MHVRQKHTQYVLGVGNNSIPLAKNKNDGQQLAVGCKYYILEIEKEPYF